MRAGRSDVSADPKAFWGKNLGGEFPAPPTPRWGPAGGALVRWCTSAAVRRDAIQCARWTGRLGSMTIPENVLRELWVGKDRGFLPFAHSCYRRGRAPCLRFAISCYAVGAQTGDHVRCRGCTRRARRRLVSGARSPATLPWRIKKAPSVLTGLVGCRLSSIRRSVASPLGQRSCSHGR